MAAQGSPSREVGGGRNWRESWGLPGGSGMSAAVRGSGQDTVSRSQRVSFKRSRLVTLGSLPAASTLIRNARLRSRTQAAGSPAAGPPSRRWARFEALRAPLAPGHCPDAPAEFAQHPTASTDAAQHRRRQRRQAAAATAAACSCCRAFSSARGSTLAWCRSCATEGSTLVRHVGNQGLSSRVHVR